MNVKTLSRAIGATVLVSFPGAGGTIGVYCAVRDVRRTWGRIDLYVAPVGGSGSAWVSLDRVERTQSGVCDFAQPALTA